MRFIRCNIYNLFVLKCSNGIWKVYRFIMEIEFEDIKGIMRICKSKDRHHNDQKKKNTTTNNDLQDIAQKTKDRVTRTPLKIGGCGR